MHEKKSILNIEEIKKCIKVYNNNFVDEELDYFAYLTINDGASDGLINELEKKLKRKLPKDLREFYKYTNGLEIGRNHLEIYSIERLMEDINCPFEVYIDANGNDFIEIGNHNSDWKLIVNLTDNYPKRHRDELAYLYVKCDDERWLGVDHIGNHIDNFAKCMFNHFWSEITPEKFFKIDVRY